MKIGKINVMKLTAVLLALLLCFAMVGCGGGTESETESESGEDPSVETEPEEELLFDGPVLSVGDSVTLGEYYNMSANEKTDLVWKVIKVEKHRALLITEKTIDHVPFDEVAYKAGTTINWELSSIRGWLNNDFYAAAFDAEDQARILNGGAEGKIAISTRANIRTDLGACADTYDKVFLPSADEVEELFKDDAARMAKGTVYAMDRGARFNDSYTSWWLRTMGETHDRAAVVLHDGEISYAGYNINFGSAAVRPCVWIAANTDYKDPNPIVTLEKAKVGSRVEFGAYEQDGDSENGREALVWKVVETDGDKLLLVAENILDMQKFYAVRSDTSWKAGTIRKWLNSTFMNGAFSEQELTKLLDTEVKTASNPETGVEGGETTTDKLFILSVDEILKYFPEQNDRCATATAFAASRGVSVDPIYGTSGYWTRTMGEDMQTVAYVYYYGGINYNGIMARTDYLGVRPAMWITK